MMSEERSMTLFSIRHTPCGIVVRAKEEIESGEMDDLVKYLRAGGIRCKSRWIPCG